MGSNSKKSKKEKNKLSNAGTKANAKKPLLNNRQMTILMCAVCVVFVILAIGIIMGRNNSDKHHVEIEIENYGTIALELDAGEAPITVANFISLAESGFYNGLTIHRVVPGFVIQGGDPYGDGSGGSGNPIKGEFSANGVDNNISHKRGVISMARAGYSYDSASSQFFIVHEDSEKALDGLYAAFGEVTDGMEIVDAICENVPIYDTDTGYVAAENQPVIKEVKVID